jgi:malate dehydrogenase
VDGQSGMAISHEMDLQQVVAAGATGAIGIIGPEAVADAAVVVVTAGVPLTVNRSRLVYLRDNAPIVDAVTAAVDPAATIVMVTNPVDPLVTFLRRCRGLDRRRVLGYTANDGLRLRTAIGDVLGVAGNRIDAWVVGEHGDTCVPLLDRVRVDDEPVALDGAQRAAPEAFLRTWYARTWRSTPAARPRGRRAT